MKLCIVGTPRAIEVQWIIEEAYKRGHEPYALSLYDVTLTVKEGSVEFRDRNGLLDRFDVYLFRGISRHLWEGLLLAQWLYEKHKIIVDERLATKRYLPTKASTSFWLAKEGLTQPETIEPMGINSAKRYLKKAKYPIVLKDAWGRKGKRVFLAKNYNKALAYVNYMRTEKLSYLIQEYIPVNYDTRVLVVGDRALGAMRRTAPENDFRSNLAVGGVAKAVDLPQKMAEIAICAAKACEIEIAGVDILEYKGNYYILEVNRCPQFRGFQASTNVNVAREIVLYLESKYGKN